MTPNALAPAAELQAEVVAVVDPEQAAADAEQARKEAEAQEYAQVKQWFKRIEASRKVDSDQRKQWKKWRSFLAGKPEDEDGEGREFLVDAPLLQSVIEGTMANVYAQNPDVSCVPEESVDETRYEQVRAFGKTLQIVLSRMFRDGNLKGAIKRTALSAMTNNIGWIKPMLQLDKRTDPIIRKQISDMQDNLQRIDFLRNAINDPAQCGELDTLKAELTDQLRALEERVEVTIARGAVFDFLRSDDVQVDGACKELIDYPQADWIAQREFLPVDKAKERYPLGGDKWKGATTYGDKLDEENPAAKASEGKGFVALWEVWDRTTNTIYTLAEGLKCYARKPYSPNPASRRFYPFFALAFHWIDGERWPRSDVDLGHKLQEEASRALSGFAEHRRRVRPKTIFNKHQLTPADADAIANAEAVEMVGVAPVDPGADVRTMVAPIVYPQVDAGLYDISPYRAAIEELFGQQDASRGGIVKAKTATEAGIAEEGRQSRIDWRRDAVEEFITEIAQYLAELALQAMPVEEAVRYAGPGAMWPELSKDEIYALLSISIRGGSSGKPDTKAEREAWSVLLPMLDKSITEIAGLMSNPQTKPLADVKVELLKETIRRMDDRIDVERFIPKLLPMLPAAGNVTPFPPAGPATPQTGATHVA